LKKSDSVHRIPIAIPVTGEEERAAISEVLASGWLTQGPKVAAFEKAFAARHGVKHALATTSCTTALHLALLALGVGPGDDVIVPSFTWVATANAVIYCGARPILADVDANTFNINPADVARRITPKVKAIIAVHLFGLTADMDALKEAAPGVPIIEDAACAAGASYKGQSAGSLGAAGCFSFHPRKVITTGEGGMVTTNDNAISKAMNIMRNHGASVPEETRHSGAAPFLLPGFDTLGFNYRMTDLQGAMGLAQLAKLDRFIAERNEIAAAYARELAGIEWLRAPVTPEGYCHGWQSYVVMMDGKQAPMSRDAVMAALKEQGVDSRPGTHSVHMLGYYAARYGYKPDDYPVSRMCAEQTMALPMHNKMTIEDAARAAAALRSLR